MIRYDILIYRMHCFLAESDVSPCSRAHLSTPLDSTEGDVLSDRSRSSEEEMVSGSGFSRYCR